MIESGWLFIGFFGILLTLITLMTQTEYVRMFGSSANAIAIYVGTLAAITWGVWTFGTLNIEVYRDATVFTSSEPELTLLGIAFTLVPAYIAFTGPLEIVSRARDTRQEEV